MSLAVPEYISEMFEGDYIDREDVADLKQSPNIVRGIPSFQYFFVSGFILPDCLSPILMVGRLKYGISDNPAEELPIK